MNIIQRIKNEALKNAPVKDKKKKVILDTDQDEVDVAQMMRDNGFGDDLVTTAKKSRWCRWDVEGEGVKAEVKTRRYTKPEWDTWVIDQHKVDHLIENYPDDELYFINVYEGKYHLYTMSYVYSCEIKHDYVPYEKRTKPFYHIPKDGWLIELASGEENSKVNWDEQK